MAATLVSSGTAFGKGQGHDRKVEQREERWQDGRDDREEKRKEARRDDRRFHDQHATRGVGPDFGYYRGDRFPVYNRSYTYVVNDWRGHHLSAPPRGHHWVQSGADYVLVAIATGVILQVVLAQ